MPEVQKRRSKIQKHPIENYKHYTIYIISGMSPVMFTAEKADPSKGITLTNDNLEKLKQDIDAALNYALSININTYEGPDNSKILQNPKVRIQSTAGEFDGFAVVIKSDYNIDIMIEKVENAPVRKSKKHKKRNSKLNLIKIVYRNKTHVCR